jgi:lon-related putative ATP-dependent protease
LPEVLDYLGEVGRDIEENADAFLVAGMAQAESGEAPAPAALIREPPSFRRYAVNVLVDHRAAEGAPIIHEDHPTHQSLVGRIEHMARFGTLMTDFGLLVPGALHRANGGYLILDAEKVLTGNFGWQSLKRALRSEEIRIESLEQLLSLASTVSLEPEPIPLDVKVILVGSPLLYYLLVELDPEFGELFKVAADFDDRVERSAETRLLYARLIAAAVRRRNLKPLDRSAVARVIDHASRMAEDSEKLSTQIRGTLDLLEEADHWAEQSGKPIVGAAEIQAAIDARIRRADRFYRRLQEEITRDTLRIETEGERIGQINGLSVLSIGGFAFGHPTRITARVRLGKGEIIDIEREVALGGPLHSKGVLILTGFLGGRYGRNRPLALTASLVFEQSYGGVEGDSASAAELFVLLSALAEIPLKQSVAVTGSIDQHGRIQAIGGVNEKIEAFFDVCRGRGLAGQSVLIPAANVKHLMLRQDVVEAAANGKFHIRAIETVDQGIEILTGIPAGTADASGLYPLGSFNHAVTARLDAFTKAAAPPDNRHAHHPSNQRDRAPS